MPVASGSAQTRFGIAGWGERRAGSFAGKAAGVTPATPVAIYIHQPGTRTQAQVSGTFSLVSGYAYAFPFIVCHVGVRVTQVHIDVTTLHTGKVARIALYRWGPKNVPLDRITQSGSEQSLASVAKPSATLTTILPVGRYFLVLATDSSTAVLNGLSREATGMLGTDVALGAPGTHWQFVDAAFVAGANLPQAGGDLGNGAIQTGNPALIDLLTQPVGGV